MASFTIRVELHGATRDHYLRLHGQLAQRGITTTIVADNGAKYHLPPAEYNYEGNATRAAVLGAVRECAAAVGLPNAVLVTERNGCMWEGLQPA
jgi:hypothetical protein